MYTLGIETSCDDTSCAVLKGNIVLSNITISSLRLHRKYGGIIPEIASRNHLKVIDKVLNIALKQAKVKLTDIGLISVTVKPGLIGSLLVGTNFAKALALGLNLPFIGVNHLYAHLYAPFLNNAHRINFPFIGLVVSGGHSEIFLVDDFTKITTVGATRDDACGEAYDKVARFYGLGFPGGPAIDKIYKKNKAKIPLKCGKINYDFSFSGIKTALVYRKIELEKKKQWNRKIRDELLSSFQESVVSALVDNTIKAAKDYSLKVIVVGGGVSANKLLRKTLKERALSQKIKVLLSPLEFSADNGAIVGGLGYYLFKKKGKKSKLDIKVEPN